MASFRDDDWLFLLIVLFASIGLGIALGTVVFSVLTLR